MTTTLVLGHPHSGRSRHAASLLSAHPQVTLVLTRAATEATGHDDDQRRPSAESSELPDHWTALETADLTRALLNSRNPVLIDNLPDWVTRVLDERGLWEEPAQARATIDELVDELVVALSAIPFETVTISCDSPGRGPEERERLLDELVAGVNARVSAASSFVHVVMAGRILDLSDAPQVGQL